MYRRIVEPKGSLIGIILQLLYCPRTRSGVNAPEDIRAQRDLQLRLTRLRDAHSTFEEKIVSACKTLAPKMNVFAVVFEEVSMSQSV